jgi:hypothetical protein
MADIWQDLYAAGADLVLSAHSHDYERFAKQNNAATGETVGACGSSWSAPAG